MNAIIPAKRVNVKIGCIKFTFPAGFYKEVEKNTGIVNIIEDISSLLVINPGCSVTDWNLLTYSNTSI